MPHVEVHPPSVGEKPSVSRGLIVSPMVEIEDASPLNVKQVVSNLVGKPGRGMVGLFLVDQESVFGFKSKNTVQHLSSPRRIEAPSAGDAIGLLA